MRKSIFDRMSEREMKKWIASNGKRANTRIATLEKTNNITPALQTVQSLAEQNPTIYGVSSSGHTKFNLANSFLSKDELRQKAEEIQQFLWSETSTKTGAEQYAKRHYGYLDEQTKNRVSFETFQSQLYSGLHEFLLEYYGYNELINFEKSMSKAFATGRSTMTQLLNVFEKSGLKESHLRNKTKGLPNDINKVYKTLKIKHIK